MTNYQVFIERVGGSIKYKVAAYLEIQAANEDDAFNSQEVQAAIDVCYGKSLCVTIHGEECPTDVYTWEVEKIKRKKTVRVEAYNL